MCLLPAAEDRLLFLLVYLKTHFLQVVQEQLFVFGQTWTFVVLPSGKHEVRLELSRP